MQYQQLLNIPEDPMALGQEEFGITNESHMDAVRIIHEWLDMQPHLPKNIDPERTKRVYLTSKCSIEKTKQFTDMYYTLRQAIPEFYKDRDPSTAQFQSIMNNIAIVPFPRTFHGVRLSSLAVSPETANFSAYDYYRYAFMMQDLRLVTDFTTTDILIFDAKCLKVGHLAKFTPNVIKRAVVCSQQAYGTRIKEMHFINYPSAIEPFVSSAKKFMKEKVAKRIHMHKDLESLHKCIPPEYLPSDYGGTQKSMAELQGLWKEELLRWKDWFLADNKAVVDESKRPGKNVTDELLGTHGSFRKLDVD